MFHDGRLVGSPLDAIDARVKSVKVESTYYHAEMFSDMAQAAVPLLRSLVSQSL